MLDSELYNKAADLIEKGWTQQAYARNKEGYDVDPGKNDATSWCLSGALWLVVCGGGPFTDTSSRFGPILNKLFENLKLRETAASWNDRPGRTQGQVVILLRNAAARSLLSEGE